MKIKEEALLNSGSNHLANGMARLIGAHRSPWRRLKSVTTRQAVKGLSGVDTPPTLESWVKVAGFRAKVGAPPTTYKDTMRIVLHVNKKNRLEEAFSYAYEFHIQAKTPTIIPGHKAQKAAFRVLAASTAPLNRNPERAMLELVKFINEFFEGMAKNFELMARMVGNMHIKGDFNDIAQYVKKNGDTIYSNKTSSLHINTKFGVDVYGQAHGRTFGFELILAQRGKTQTKGQSKIVVAPAKSKSTHIVFKTAPSSDPQQAVFNFYQMAMDLSTRCESMAHTIGQGLNNKAKAMKMIKEGFQKNVVFSPRI